MDRGQTNDGVLSGIRIVEISGGHATSVATRWLAEVGADVVRIEGPDGDSMRTEQPAAYASWNRSKQSVALDLDIDVDRTRFDALLESADVLVHGWTPEQSEQRRLSVDALARRLPSLIVATVTAYPVGHADAERYGDEMLVQARVGMMDEQEALRDGPMFIRLPVASWGAAFLLAGGIAARLLERERTGRANPIHTSLMQGALAPAALHWQRAGDPPTWLAEHTLPKLDMPPHITIFECADGRWLQVMGGFTKFDELRPILAEAGEDDLFGGRAGLDNRDRWARVFALRTAEEWTQIMWPAGALCMPILDVGEVLGVEQARVNGYTVEVDDPAFGPTVQAGSPFEVGAPSVVRNPAPAHPQPTVEWSDGAPRTHPMVTDDAAVAVPLPLSGVRVVDFGAYVAGPFGSQCLADFGADVIKVEPIGGEKGREINQFTGSQRGKRFIEIDLRNPRSHEVIKRLVMSADVVMHNMRVGASRKLGIDEDTVRSYNPNAVFGHSSGYGNDGPWSALPAFDPTGFALSGWAHGISGPGNRPSWLRMSAIDCLTGVANFVGITLALFARERTGRPATATSSLLAVAVTFSGETLLAGAAREPVALVPVNVEQTGMDPWACIYRAEDGWLAISAKTDAQRAGVARVLGAEPTGFVGLVRGRTLDDVVAELEHEGVPVERVMLDHRDAFFDAELVRGSGFVRRVEGTPYGWFENPGGFWSDRVGVLRNDRPIAAVGQHTVDVLQELGYSAAEVADLLADCVVGTGPRSQSPLTLVAP